MKIVAFCLYWLLILTAPGVMAQQGAARHPSWDVLRQLQAGEKLQVQRKTGKIVKGTMISLSDTELVIERKRKNVSFGQDEVKKVWRIIPPRRSDKVKATALGAGVGSLFGLLFAVGVASNECGSGCDGNEMAAAFAVPVVVGVLIGYFTQRGECALIYSAP
jgi:hypothetical protein